MDILTPTPLLGGLSPERFMRRHWQKKPLLIRRAVPVGEPLVSRAVLFDLAARDDVESRLVVRDGKRWTLRQGPLPRRALPPAGRPGWTLLVQGLDLHLQAAHALLSRFRFVPDARLDDLMVSWASDGGGVGAHVDSYDVFLLQLQGRRRWRIGRLVDDTLDPDAPLKLLRNFQPEEEWVLEPGDMLYLPPRWAHDGVAEGECMTASIGFRASPRSELGREVLQRLIDGAEPPNADPLYRDPKQAATDAPGQVPPALLDFAVDAAQRWLRDPRALARALGESLTEPKPQVWFDSGESMNPGEGIALDRRTRMMYDDHHVFINGESFLAAGRDARLMRQLADERCLSAASLARLSDEARGLLDQWFEAGWLLPGHSNAQEGGPR